jgi:hypothetical protein
MSGAEARNRRPRYKQYKRVRDAEAFARRLGVSTANYADNLEIANNANHALFLAHERGVPMPQSVTVRPFDQPDDDPTNFAFYDAGLADEPGGIVINAAHEIWTDPGAFLEQVNEESHEFSTSDPHHAVAHELGELAMHQSVGWEAFTPGQDEYEANEAQFQEDEEGLAHIYDVMGDRATQSHSEFVAEMFAAMLLGRAEVLGEDEELMTRFRRYGGETVPHYFEG